MEQCRSENSFAFYSVVYGIICSNIREAEIHNLAANYLNSVLERYSIKRTSFAYGLSNLGRDSRLGNIMMNLVLNCDNCVLLFTPRHDISDSKEMSAQKSATDSKRFQSF